MNEIRLIDEGNDEDFGVAEYDFGARPQSARAAALQAKLRAEAKARLAPGATGMSQEEMIEASLKKSANMPLLTYVRRSRKLTRTQCWQLFSTLRARAAG